MIGDIEKLNDVLSSPDLEKAHENGYLAALKILEIRIVIAMHLCRVTNFKVPGIQGICHLNLRAIRVRAVSLYQSSKFSAIRKHARRAPFCERRAAKPRTGRNVPSAGLLAPVSPNCFDSFAHSRHKLPGGLTEKGRLTV